MCSNCNEMTPFEEATAKIKRARKIEKIILWFLIFPLVVGYGLSVCVIKYFDTHETKSFYSQNVKHLKNKK